jgi:hypothetical protein
MKKPLFILLIASITLSGCGAVFGGRLTDCQKNKPAPGQPRRQIRPAALIADIIWLIPALPVDLISGGIYMPCKDSLQIKQASKDDSIERQSHFSVSTDLAQCGMFQPNIGIEYRKGTLAFGLNVGYVFPLGYDSVNFLANGQYKLPAPIYYGEAVRLYFKHYSSGSPFYWSVQAVVKDLWYNNRGFSDHYYVGSNDNPLIINYTMSEKATVLGIEALVGYDARLGNHFRIDCFGGLGFHERIRVYDITWSSADTWLQRFPQYTPGTYHDNIGYPTPVFGLKLKYSFIRKK